MLQGGDDERQAQEDGAGGGGPPLTGAGGGVEPEGAKVAARAAQLGLAHHEGEVDALDVGHQRALLQDQGAQGSAG